jgi:hypothetical protein
MPAMKPHNQMLAVLGLFMNEYIEDLEEYLGVKAGFFYEIQMDDDWLLVIKLYSLIEGATSLLITENLNRSELQDAFSAMQMGTTSNGKLAFVKALKLLPDHHIKYIETLGWVRNKFAHNISTSHNDIKAFLGTISAKRRRECEKNLSLAESVTVKEKTYSGREFFREYPKISIYTSGQVVLERIRQFTIGGQQQNKIRKELDKKYLEENGPIKIKLDEHGLDKKR